MQLNGRPFDDSNSHACMWEALMQPQYTTCEGAKLDLIHPAAIKHIARAHTVLTVKCVTVILSRAHIFAAEPIAAISQIPQAICSSHHISSLLHDGLQVNLSSTAHERAAC